MAVQLGAAWVRVAVDDPRPRLHAVLPVGGAAPADVLWSALAALLDRPLDELVVVHARGAPPAVPRGAASVVRTVPAAVAAAVAVAGGVRCDGGAGAVVVDAGHSATEVTRVSRGRVAAVHRVPVGGAALDAATAELIGRASARRAGIRAGELRAARETLTLQPVVRVGAIGAWSRTVGYWNRSTWSGRRTLRGQAVVDGVATNALAHAVVTALAVVGCRTLEDVETVETDLYRANAIDCDDTSVVRVRTTSGLDVTCALTLSAPIQREPEVHVEGANGSVRFSYTTDRVEVDSNGQQRTEVTGRTDLVENLLAHRRDGTPLLVPLASTGAFMRVLSAIAEADEPIRIDPRAIQWEGEGSERRGFLPDIETWLAKAVRTGQTFTELAAPWAHRERDRILVRAEVGGVEVARYRDGRGTIPTSSPRPVLHPVRTLAGVVLTARHPADHDWHLGVGVAIPDVNGSSFWGGGTYVHGEGYVLLDNHGQIVGSTPEEQGDGFRQQLDWIGHDGSIPLREERAVRWAPIDEQTWQLTFESTLRAQTDATLGEAAE